MVVLRTLCAIVALAALVGAADPSYTEWKATQKSNKEAAAAVEAKDAKMAAVDKVLSMLKTLQSQVMSEGESEAATYNKFSCFCKTTQTEKSDAIKTGKDDKASLTADISKLSKERDDLDTKIAGLEKDIETAEGEMKKATETSNAALKVYTTNEADMKAALSALEEAIKVLKSSKSPSLVQLQAIGQTVRQAALLADALGLGGDRVQKVATYLLQQTSSDVPVEMEDYKFHSDSIIDTLENLQKDFRKQKTDLDAEEVSRVKTYDSLIQDKTDLVKAKTVEMEEAKKTRDEKIADIATSSQELTTTSATLLDDMQYLDELNSICSQKAKTWDQRSTVRANELTALTSAIEIIKTTVVNKTQASTIRFAQTGSILHLADAVANSDSEMEAIEAEAEAVEDDSGATGFLQKRSIKSHKPQQSARDMILTLLNGKGKQMGSTLLTSLASRIAADPFAKIKKLIQELIERLLAEAANEANQKGWCDKAIADAKQKREYAADEIEGLNSKLAKLEALSSKLGQEISVLDDEISELNTDKVAAEKTRGEEKAENENTVSEAKAGKAAVESAIDILDKFYKTNAKQTVALSLAQGPLDDAPDTDFKIGEAYKGASAEAGGIIGMMEVIQADFVRTIKETEAAEQLAKEAHLQFMTETGMSLAEKTTAKKEKTKLKDETDSNFSDAEDELDTQMTILKTAIKELMELKPACIDTGMSYTDRVAMREEEIAALKKALCILGAYEQYGPDGLSDVC